MFDVGMTCEGCAGAVKRILGKVDGVNNVDADVAAKRVTVTHDDTVTKEMMLPKLEKWGAAAGKSVALAPCCSAGTCS
eukprot:CAMPEP_0183309298 /NCGR_PEP_ID=MMETSP0160_2-20130417/24909_1 /TAXON_ID=2839 ORGANISM="Odontella Sinensis, Strain Grunow 1884" /NCGR_SAMPLE_ID=MMETSP0160_2 /ASSEMBLY_ACC=CAM_ASM_000250 /LENGTH=77 /DNA_ID=CAMNT_0025473307 /DNA_START=101 /DNA_END=337 /DNA_ORIENTATION=+